MRKTVLTTGEIYHIFTRSIAGYSVFSTHLGNTRFVETLRYYRYANRRVKFSIYLTLSPEEQLKNDRPDDDQLVQIIAYCLMPTHVHLILKQLEPGGISIFMRKVLDSYSKYFNINNNRHGPLWESRFKDVLVTDDEQLLHLTRYLHLNPVSAGLINNPEQWPFSSYGEYLGKTKTGICAWDGLFEIDFKRYKKFVHDRTDYQKSLSSIKRLLNKNYTG